MEPITIGIGAAAVIALLVAMGRKASGAPDAPSHHIKATKVTSTWCAGATLGQCEYSESDATAEAVARKWAKIYGPPVNGEVHVIDAGSVGQQTWGVFVNKEMARVFYVWSKEPAKLPAIKPDPVKGMPTPQWVTDAFNAEVAKACLDEDIPVLTKLAQRAEDANQHEIALSIRQEIAYLQAQKKGPAVITKKDPIVAPVIHHAADLPKPPIPQPKPTPVSPGPTPKPAIPQPAPGFVYWAGRSFSKGEKGPYPTPEKAAAAFAATFGPSGVADFQKQLTPGRAMWKSRDMVFYTWAVSKAVVPQPTPVPAPVKPAPVPVQPAPVPSPTPKPTPIVAPPPEPDARVAAREITEYLTSIGGYAAARYKEDHQKLIPLFTRLGAPDPNGMYGPGVAKAIMAQGIVPAAPFYWPKTNTTAVKNAFLATVDNYRAADPQRKAQWDKLYADSVRS